MTGGPIVVIGGGGFIGSHVCAALRRDRIPTVAVGRTAPVPVISGDDIAERDFVEVNLDDWDRLAPLMAGAETVICLASSSLPASSNDDMGAEVHQHVEATVGLAQMAARIGVRRFVFASSGGTVYGRASTVSVDELSPMEPMSAYGVSKLAIENYLRVLGNLTSMQTLSLRVANPYGPGQRTDRRHGFISTAIECGLRGSPLVIWGDGSTRRDFVFIEDVAQAFVAASRYDGPYPVINIGSGEATSLLEAVACVQEVLNVELDVRFEPGRPVDVPVNSLAINRAEAELDWRPTVDLKTGIRETAKTRAVVDRVEPDAMKGSSVAR
ncbi:MAG: NAD-dependent epimerase/dehydratase family protein [Acidimicrobiia bacterium]|nr:NAD-dependent epimerase/dehydratase family protein [Acidimicrobiia bacterium]